MISSTDLDSLVGRTMHGQDGEKIGKIVDVYESTDSADGTFVTVSTGLFGGHASFVPLAKASMTGDQVVVPYDKAMVKDAPKVQADEELTSAEEDRLYQHYQLTGGTSTAGTGAAGTNMAGGEALAAGTGRHAGETAIPRGTQRDDSDGDGVFDDVSTTAVGRDTSGLTTDDAMTRSEERLHVGTERVEAGRARLRKRIVTEVQNVTVPITTEQVRVTREPITEATMPRAMDGPALSEEEHEVRLTTERPVIEKDVVAVERVRLATDTVHDNVQVSEQVRKENITVDEDSGVAGQRGRMTDNA